MAKKRFLLRSWVLPAVLLISTLARAASPEETVKAYMTAMSEKGMESTADFFHPAELQRFKDMLIPLFRAAPETELEVALVSMFGTGTTLAQLEAMTPKAFMAAFMKAVGKQMQGIKFESIEVLGAVPEKNLVHVVARIGIAGPSGLSMKKMEVVTTIRDRDGFKLALTGQMEGLAEAMKSAR